LCADCRRRWQTNPLRVLDCKVPGCKEATAAAPLVLDHLCGDCADHFGQVQTHLNDLGTPFEVNPRMVRGLDYYTRTTFEMVTGSLGAQNAVAAGGRYDGLIRDLGGPPLPGIGFAIGVERLVLLKAGDQVAPRLDCYIATLSEEAARRAFVVMNRLQRSGLQVETDFEGKSLKAQMRRAGKLGARFVVILGGDELAAGKVQLRDMDAGSQQDLPLAELEERLHALMAKG